MKLFSKVLISIFVLLLLHLTACESSDIAMEEVRKTARVTKQAIVLLLLREGSIALEEYYNVNNKYPSSDSLVELKKTLTPYHPRNNSLYILDPWDEKFLVNSSKDSCVISSKGEDKIGEHGFSGAIEPENNNSSITLKNSVFVQYPTNRSTVVKKYQEGLNKYSGNHRHKPTNK